VLRAVKDAVAGRATVMLGTGSNDTARTVAATARAADAGADAVLVVTPYYNRPDQRGLEAHFTAAAAATDLPMVVYDIPSRSARIIEVATHVALAEVDNIVGVKDATADCGRAGDLLTRHRRRTRWLRHVVRCRRGQPAAAVGRGRRDRVGRLAPARAGARGDDRGLPHRPGPCA
jgi:dihydrodipicolinate synthase/N-acetylneuraminate lyase